MNLRCKQTTTFLYSRVLYLLPFIRVNCLYVNMGEHLSGVYPVNVLQRIYQCTYFLNETRSVRYSYMYFHGIASSTLTHDVIFRFSKQSWVACCIYAYFNLFISSWQNINVVAVKVILNHKLLILKIKRLLRVSDIVYVYSFSDYLKVNIETETCPISIT